MSLREDLLLYRQSVIFNGVTEGVALPLAGGTNSIVLEVDLGDCQEILRKLAVSALSITDDDTAPGTSKTFTVNLFWSDEAIAAPLATNVPVICAARTSAGSAKTLTNAINTRQQWDLHTNIVPAGRFLYIAISNTAFDAGSNENFLKVVLRAVKN